MKTKREMPLLEALDEIVSEVQRLKGNGSARLNGQEIQLDDPVTLEIEKEASKKGGELEFEIKWPARKSMKSGSLAVAGAPKRRIRRRWLAIGALAALGAGAMLVARRSHGSSDEEDEDEA
jgi:hypothetical protein